MTTSDIPPKVGYEREAPPLAIQHPPDQLSPEPDTAQRHRTLWQRLTLPFFGVLVPFLVFGWFAHKVRRHRVFSFDDPTLLDIHHYASPFLDKLAVVVAVLAGPAGMVPLCALIFALLWRQGWPRIAGFWATAVGGSALLNLAAKGAFERVRPDLWLSVRPEHSWSFPSGHAMASMAFASALCCLAWRTRWRWPALCFALVFVPLVAFTRAYLGVHYPSDLMAGWAASCAWVLGARWAWRGAFRSVEKRL